MTRDLRYVMMRIATLRLFSPGPLAALAVLAALVAAPVGAVDVHLVVNGDFSAGQAPWWATSSVTPAVNGGILESMRELWARRRAPVARAEA